jgi:hypothetical protein
MHQPHIVISQVAGYLAMDLCGTIQLGLPMYYLFSKTCAAGYHMAYNSKNRNEFVFRKSDGTMCTFRQSPKGLFYLDTREAQNDKSLFATTVADNHYKYTNRDYSCAELARKFKKLLAGLVLSNF